jgi:hypothetical protein
MNSALLEALQTSANEDGGWGYTAGRTSRLEPTCWALLALLDAPDADVGDQSRVVKALALLGAHQNEAGLLVDVPGALPNYAFNGLGAIAIRRAASLGLSERKARPNLDALVSGILKGEGVRTKKNRINRQNNELAAWPWHDGTSSWIEPTAWCALALKAAGRSSVDARLLARLADADRMMADRCCLSGGWNYGNSNMLGKELRPYVISSALALLALQDRRALPEVARSVNWLAANWYTEPSAGAISLSIVALRLYGRPTHDLERTLLAHLAEPRSVRDAAICGLTLYALNGAHHGYAAFAL